MDELFNWLVKAGPSWTILIIFGTAAASILFYVTNKQYRKMTVEAHTEQLKLKEAANIDLKVRIAELDAEKTNLRERVHISANDQQRLVSENAILRSRPNVDTLADVLKELTKESKVNRESQATFNQEFLEALKTLNKHILEKTT